MKETKIIKDLEIIDFENIDLSENERRFISVINDRFHIYTIDFQHLDKLSNKRLSYIYDVIPENTTLNKYMQTGVWIKFEDLILINNNVDEYCHNLKIVDDFLNMNRIEQIMYVDSIKENKCINIDEALILHMNNIIKEVLVREEVEKKKSCNKALREKYKDILTILGYNAIGNDDCDKTGIDILMLKVEELGDKYKFEYMPKDFKSRLIHLCEDMYLLGKIFGKRVERFKM